MCNNGIFELTVKDFSNILDIDEKYFHPEVIKCIQDNRLRYVYLSKQKRDKLIISLLKKMDGNKFSMSGQKEKEKWEKGWQESLDEFISSGFKEESLIPKYIHLGEPIRVYGDYVEAVDEDFELKLIDILRTFIYYYYLKDKKCVYDFGCGTGFNLVALARMDQTKEYHGLDWVPQSKEMLRHIRDNYKLNINGHVFNMFQPDFDLEIQKDSVCMTTGSLEQIGKDFDPFLDFMLKKPFSLYIHINSILEYYDTENNLPDYIVYKTEIKRNYLNGYFTRLKQLEDEGVIRILKMKKIPIGSTITDGYSLCVWEKK